MSVANSVERMMLDLINEERARHGLPPLKLALDLNESAEDHSRWMLNTDTFSHTGAGGSSSGDRMRDAGFTFSGSWASAENIALQSEQGASGIADDVEDLFNSLMNSSGHRANILSARYEYVGIGIETGDYKGYDVVVVTQNFAATSASVALDNGGVAASSGAGADSLVIRGTNGSDTLNGTDKADEITGRKGNDDLYGRGSADKLKGNEGADIVNGGGGEDVLLGGRGCDDLRGQRGDDKLFGGKGADMLTGGGGSDLFIFRKDCGKDRITDFQDDRDTIRLDEDLWQGDLSKAQVINRFAEVRNGNTVFDFGDDRLVVEGFTDLAELKDDLQFI